MRSSMHCQLWKIELPPIGWQLKRALGLADLRPVTAGHVEAQPMRRSTGCAKEENGKSNHKPEVRSANSSGNVSRELTILLQKNGLRRHRIKPRCPQWTDRADAPNSPRGIGRGCIDQPARNGKSACPRVSAMQRAASHSALGYLE
jgi:hypothetical protein